MALANLGANSRVETFDPLPEDTTESRLAHLWFHNTRKQLLEVYDWSFARTRAALALHSVDPPSGVWSYRYQYPPDCLSARYLEPVALDDDALPFEEEQPSSIKTRSILTDVADAVLVYTKDVDTPELYSPGFVKALAALLSADFSMSLIGDLKTRDYWKKNAEIEISLATGLNANQSIQEPARGASWVRNR